MSPHLGSGHPLTVGARVMYSPAAKTRGARPGTVIEVMDGRLGDWYLYVVEDDEEGYDTTVGQDGITEVLS